MQRHAHHGALPKTGGLQLQTNKVNEFMNPFIGTSRDFLKVQKLSEQVGIEEIF
jgi:hypothetical protein